MLIYDVVTSGTTLMAGARRLNETFPNAVIAAFALARVQSVGEPASFTESIVERIRIAGTRCRREAEPTETLF